MKHTFLYLLSIFCLAQAANLVRLADAPATVIGFWRLLFAGLILLPFALRSKELSKLVFITRNDQGHLLKWIFLTGFFFFAHLLTFFIAAQKTTIANCMILFCLNPLFTSLLSTLLMKEAFPRRLFLAYPLAFLAILILVQHNLQFSPEKISGDISALVSGLFYTLYLLSALKVRRQFSNTSFATIMYLVTCVLFAGSVLFMKQNFWGYPPITWIAIAGNVLIPTLLGHFLFTYLLKFLNVNWMSCGKLIEPMISSLVAYYAFSEAIGKENKFAFILTGLSVLILFWDRLFSKPKMSST